MNRIPKSIRSGQRPVYEEVQGQSLEQSIVKITTEVYSLVIRHVKQSGRSHPHPFDFHNALKVVLLPSYSKWDAMQEAMKITHIEDMSNVAEKGARRTQTLTSLSDAARLVAGMDHAGPLQKEKKRTRERQTPEPGPNSSLFPAPQPITPEDQMRAVAAIASLLQMTDMPDELEDEFCFCDDETQQKDNDMFLMERADYFWDEYLQESSEHTWSRIENTLVRAVVAADKAFAEAEARAIAAWTAEHEEEAEEAEEEEGADV